MAAAYRPPRRRAEPRSARIAAPANPSKARAAWKALCVGVIGAAARADEPALGLVDLLRAAPKGSFPLPAQDVRRVWAEEWRGAVERWRAEAGYATRRMFAPGLAAQASCVLDLLIVLGAEEATRSRAAMGQRDE